MSKMVLQYFPLSSERKPGIFRNIPKTSFVHIFRTDIKRASCSWLPSTATSVLIFSIQTGLKEVILSHGLPCQHDFLLSWWNSLFCWACKLCLNYPMNGLCQLKARVQLNPCISRFYSQGGWSGVFWHHVRNWGL